MEDKKLIELDKNNEWNKSLRLKLITFTKAQLNQISF